MAQHNIVINIDVSKATEAFEKFSKGVKQVVARINRYFLRNDDTSLLRHLFYQKKGYPLGKSIRGRKKYFKRMERKLKV